MKNLRFVALVLITILGITVVTWTLATRHANPNQKALSKVKGQVEKLMLLPGDEQPTLASVEDIAKISDKFLADNAKNGDKVLIYTKNRMVIIYRPSINKIAAVGTVSIDQALVEAKGASLTVVDGSNNPQKTEDVIKKIKTAYPNLNVINGGKISRQDLPDTIVIDNTNSKDSLVIALVDVISAKRGIVPLGVEQSQTDLMVIVGKD